jgi:serine phosphatase RsbU (regulator of sigma subunit)
LLFTDGITEAMDVQGELFGLERLQAALHAVRRDPLHHVSEHLLQTVTRYRGSASQADDMTFVAVRSH